MMTRPLLITLTLAAIGGGAGAAEGKDHKSALSAGEQRRIVCVTQRDDAGQPADQKVCMTGRDWELAVVDFRRSQARRPRWASNGYPHLAYRGYFQTSASSIGRAYASPQPRPK